MKILDIALKDLRRSTRSAFTIGMSVVVPLLITGLIYFAFGGMSSGAADMPKISVGIVNADTLPQGSPLEAPLGENLRSLFFDSSVESWIDAADYPDETSARAAVDRQEIGVAVVIPAAFTTQYLAGEHSSPVLLIQDPTLTIAPLVVKNMLTAMLDGVAGGGIAFQTVYERQQASGHPFGANDTAVIIEKYQAWYTGFQRDMFHNPEQAALVMRSPAAGSSQQAGGMADLLQLIMASQMIFFAFYTGAYAMLSILREQEEGTLARMFATPTGRSLILAGKFLTVVLTVILQGLVLMIASHYAFGVDWGEPASALLALLGQVVAASGLGVLLIAFVKTAKQGGPVLGGALAGMGMLSGLFTVAVPSAPAIFDQVANFTPQGWVLKAWKVVLAGQSAADILIPAAVCVLFGIVMFGLGAVLFRKRFA